MLVYDVKFVPVTTHILNNQMANPNPNPNDVKFVPVTANILNNRMASVQVALFQDLVA